MFGSIMYRIYFFSIICWSGFIIEATHFRGGTITWKPINNNITVGSTVSVMITQTYSWTWPTIECNSSMIAAQSPPVDLGGRAGTGMNLMCNASCSTAGGYVGNEVPITGYCTDFSAALDLTVSQRSDIVNLTVGAHFTATFGTNGGWQTLALGNSTGWSISTLIDLSLRSDNGLINTPPVATCISYISVPVNIQQNIQIPVLDANNDFLRCRFANGSTECLNTCPPASLPSGTTLSSSCTLTITGPIVGAYYLVALQVEDFMTNTSTTPLSSVPLQFLIYVYATQNCTLKPLLIADFNRGDCQGAQVGVSFEISFTAINQCGSIRNITDIATLSFPTVIKSALVQNTTNTSLWTMQITWVPTTNQVGSQVFCAIAADSANVQSDQYCLTLFVGLSSVPLCPGATAAPITSSSIVETSSTLPKPTNQTNWPVIAGTSLAALALALCCSLCCWYHLLGPGANRRRRKKIRAKENNINLLQLNRNPYQKLLHRYGRKQHDNGKQNSSIISIGNSETLSSVTVSKINHREKSLIHGQGNIMIQQSSEKVADLSSRSKSCVNVQKLDRRDKIAQVLTLDRMPSTFQPSAYALIIPSSALNTAPTKSASVIKLPRFRKASIQSHQSALNTASMKSASVIKLPRFRKASVQSHQSTSIVYVEAQPTHHPQIDLNDSGRTKPKQRGASNISVTKVRRCSSAGRINRTNQRTKTTSSNYNINRVTVTKIE